MDTEEVKKQEVTSSQSSVENEALSKPKEQPKPEIPAVNNDSKPNKLKRFIMILLIVAVCIGAVIYSNNMDTTAQEMRLETYIGQVTLRDDSEVKEIVEGSRLVSKDNIETFVESSAYISLDNTKLLKVDEISHIKVLKVDSHLDIELYKGSIYFNVSEPLTEEESLDFHTNNIVTGVRGTSGVITYSEDRLQSQVVVLSGTVEVTTIEEEIQVIKVVQGEVLIATTLEDGTVHIEVKSQADTENYLFSANFLDDLDEDVEEFILPKETVPFELTVKEGLIFQGDRMELMYKGGVEGEAVILRSDNQDIATVDNDTLEIIGVSPGTTQIHVTTGDTTDILTVVVRPQGDYVIQWVDAGFEVGIREVLANPMGDIWRSDVADITTLDLRSLGIQVINDVVHFENLNRLQLWANNMSNESDISEISEFITSDEIRIIGISGGNIEIQVDLGISTSALTVELEPLEDYIIRWVDKGFESGIRELLENPTENIWASDLASIESLELTSCGITVLNDILHFNDATYLDLSYNDAIIDIGVIRGLTNLAHLDLSYNNQIIDISVISLLTNLTYLDLSYNKTISDISLLEGLTNLTFLALSQNAISDIDALEGLTNLTHLYLGGNSIDELSVLGELTNLTILSLRQNSISDISVIEGLTNLTELYLWGNSISEISALEGLTNLTYLNLWRNSISEVSALEGLVNLTYLDMSQNTISDISALRELTNLTELHLWTNNISEISALEGMTNLTKLTLSQNNISSISSLERLTNLTYLDLGNNAISDVSVLDGLTNLEEIYLSGNLVSE